MRSGIGISLLSWLVMSMSGAGARAEAPKEPLDLKMASKELEAVANGQRWTPGLLEVVGSVDGPEWKLKMEQPYREGSAGGGGKAQLWLPIATMPKKGGVLTRSLKQGACLAAGGLVQTPDPTAVMGGAKSWPAAGCAYLIQVVDWPAKKPDPNGGEQRLGTATLRVVSTTDAPSTWLKGPIKAEVVYYGKSAN